MANSNYTIDEIRFDVREEALTHVYAYVSCPDWDFIQGWRHKAFPASMPTRDIHAALCTSEENDPIMWPVRAPPEVAKSEAGQLAHAILTWDMGMDVTKPGWAYWESLRMLAEKVLGRFERRNRNVVG